MLSTKMWLGVQKRTDFLKNLHKNAVQSRRWTRWPCSTVSATRRQCLSSDRHKSAINSTAIARVRIQVYWVLLFSTIRRTRSKVMRLRGIWALWQP